MKKDNSEFPKKNLPAALDFSLMKYISDMLTATELPELSQVPVAFREDLSFKNLYNQIVDLRELTASLNKGDLQKFVYSRGYILSNLKTLQANLRHLTWQSKMIASGDLSQVVDFMGDFSESFNIMIKNLRENRQLLHKLASIDTLTQIPNRLTLDSFLSDAFTHAKETDKKLSVIIFDIDHFKYINDDYGHVFGDYVLFLVANTINGQFRTSDLFARYGGEEFMAVLPNTNSKTALKIAERALHAVETLKIVHEKQVLSATVSAGISELLPIDNDFEALVKRSDEALYRAKHEGRNRVCIN